MYNVNDNVAFLADGTTLAGIIKSVDMQPDGSYQYDILCSSKHILYKHVIETNIIGLVKYNNNKS